MFGPMAVSCQIRSAEAQICPAPPKKGWPVGVLSWKQEHLAGVSIATVRRLEAKPGDLGGYASTGKKLARALEAAGIEFTNGSHPGVRLKAKPRGPS
jgi:hypothetical protein